MSREPDDWRVKAAAKAQKERIVIDSPPDGFALVFNVFGYDTFSTMEPILAKLGPDMAAQRTSFVMWQMEGDNAFAEPMPTMIASSSSDWASRTRGT